MAQIQNARLVLTDGTDYDYDEAIIKVEEGGVLKLTQGDRVTYYAPGTWKYLEHDVARSAYDS